MSEPLRFPSRVDAWAWALMGVQASMLPAGALIVILYAADRVHEPVMLGCALLMIASGGFGLWTMRTTRYELHADVLVARAGPFRRSVILGSIESVTPTRSIESALANSLDRLAIGHRGSRDPLLVSPADREAFLDALNAACPQLSRRGDSLVSSEKR